MKILKQSRLMVVFTIITFTIVIIACDSNNNQTHIHDAGSWSIVRQETCTVGGLKELRCIGCNELLDTESITAHGHVWEEWNQEASPSYITADEESRFCIFDHSHIEIRTGTPGLPITNTNEWNTALSSLNEKIGKYSITIDGNIGIAGSTTNSFGTTSLESTLEVTIKGNGKLFLSDQGSIISIGARQTAIIDSENLKLEGLKNGQNGAIQDNNNSVLYISTGGTIELKNGIILGNVAQNGGGVYIQNGTFTMSGGQIYSNATSNYNARGGGVCLDGGTFIMNGGTISENIAHNGGGVCVYFGNFIMNNGEISVNTANSQGGGVHVYFGTFCMNDGSITRNNTSNYGSIGGGVYIYSSANFIMNGGKIFNNSADNYGAGIVNSGTFTLHNGKIYDNSAIHAGGVSNHGIFYMHGGEISGNTSSNGGGVHNSETFSMHGGEISHNTSTNSGGGIANSGVLTMHGGKISNNIASNDGGGVVIWSGTLTMNGGEIYGNNADNGGGVYVYGYSLDNYGIFRLITGTIYGSDEANTDLKNIANNGSSVYIDNNGVAQYGLLNGSLWDNNGSLLTTNFTIKAINGDL